MLLPPTIIDIMADLVIVGAGPIGSWVAAAAVADGVVDRVAAVVDPDPAVRTDLAGEMGAAAHASTVDLSDAASGDVALVSFTSRAEKAAPEIVRLVSSGYHVVTTCEELAWSPRHVWDAMHTSAASSARTIVVTGTNPGFAMDRLPLLIATASRNVTAVRVIRRVDSSKRRASLVVKSGRGTAPAEFAAGVSAGTIGHRGLDASARLIARGLRWPYHDVAVRITPVVTAGEITGADHLAVLHSGDGRSIELHLTMAWGIPDPVDRVEIDGEPPLVAEIDGGYPGDEGTTAQVVASIERCRSLTPGFYRPTDLPLRFGVP